MNLSDLNQMVSDSLRRGTTLDAFIPKQVALAVQWIERNYTFKYMETFRIVTIKQSQRILLMPTGTLVKAWIFFRIIKTDDSYKYLIKAEGKDLNQVNSTKNTLIPGVVGTPTSAVIMPGAFFQVGLSTVVLDAVPSQDFPAESMFYNYSSWPTDSTAIPGGGSTFTHPLIDVAGDLILAQAQMFMATNIMKDLRMMAAYKELRDEAVNTLTRADDETKFGGEDMKMTFNPEFDERQINAATVIGF